MTTDTELKRAIALAGAVLLYEHQLERELVARVLATETVTAPMRDTADVVQRIVYRRAWNEAYESVKSAVKAHSLT